MNIITRKEAKNLNLVTYFTGLPCPKFHVCERYTSTCNCVECIKLQSNKYYSQERELNKEKINAKKRRQNKTTRKSQISEYNSKYRLENKELIKKIYKEYYSKNKSEYYDRNYKRRSIKSGNGGSYTSEDIKEIHDLQSGKCAYCKVLLDKYHIDHIFPLYLGGSNDRSNLQLTCPTCNLSKGPKDPIVYAQSLGMLL